MNVRDIVTFCSASFFWTVCMLLFHGKDLTCRHYIFWIMSGLLFGLLLTLHFRQIRRRSVKWLLNFDDLDEIDMEGKILQKDWMDHFRNRGIIADSGFGFLLEDRLVFVQQQKDGQGQRITVLFSDIAGISDFKFLGIFNSGLKITLQSGKTECFAMDKKTGFYRAFVECIAKTLHHY